jgi:hypothetical protein
MRARGAIFLLLPMLSVFVCPAHAQQHQPWSGGFSYTYSHDGPNIILGFIRQDEAHLSGEFTFENVSGSRDKAKDVLLQGGKTSDGRFWPQVRYEARRDADAPWEPLGHSPAIGRSAKRTIKAEGKPVQLTVRLDVFQPLIRTHKMGRIVFSSGDTSQFELKDFAPLNER